MYQIVKQHHFSAGHSLHNLPPDHPCSRPHGHNYIVEAVCEADDEAVHAHPNQWVRDFGDLKPMFRWIDQRWDHRNLNDVVPDGVETTAERLAWLLFTAFEAEIPELVAVRVSETPKTWAEYRP